MRKRNRRMLLGGAAVLLLAFFHAAWKLLPVETSPLLTLTSGELRTELRDDLGRYRDFLARADAWHAAMTHAVGSAGKSSGPLAVADRETLRALWEAGARLYREAEGLKEKYRGFLQLDFKVQPQLHADAFFLAYATFVAQYDLCLGVSALVADDARLRALLNEPSGEVPAQGFETLKQRLTDSESLLKLNAGAAYTDLVADQFTAPPDVVADHRLRRGRVFRELGRNLDLFVDNPLEAVREAWK